jgi:hypothetical protein
MSEIFTFIGILWLVLLCLRFIAERASIKTEMNKVREMADARIRVVQLEPVADKGLILAYDSENHDFLGQGLSIDEVKARIMERYPEKIFLLDDKVFSALKVNLEVKLENSTAS